MRRATISEAGSAHLPASMSAGYPRPRPVSLYIETSFFNEAGIPWMLLGSWRNMVAHFKQDFGWMTLFSEKSKIENF